jgi:hypothetical protein
MAAAKRRKKVRQTYYLDTLVLLGELWGASKAESSLSLACSTFGESQNSTRREESQCRFCGQGLPDWKKNMTPANVTPCRTAVMAVVLNGQEHRITVEPGPQGRSQFEAEIRRLFGLSQDDELEFTFDCQAPGEGMCYAACHSGMMDINAILQKPSMTE